MSLACPLHVCYEQRAALSPSLCQPAPLRRKGGTRRVRLVRGGAEASGGRVPPERTLIVGQSLGGALAVLAAASRAGCAAASCRSFARLSDVVALHGGTIVRGIFPVPWPFPPLARFACGLLAKVSPAPGVAAGGAAPRAPGLSARAAAAVGRGLGA
jgi:alpha-beta hydrolase superfamily lysophospholipase